MFGPSNFVAARPQPSTIAGTFPYQIRGVTRDINNAALGNCTVKLFRTADDSLVSQTTSDASGNYSIPASNLYNNYLISYLAGAPDVEGGTINTMTGT